VKDLVRATNRTAARRDAERRFPHTVDMHVPLDEVDVRIRDMVAWCWQCAKPGAWEQHSHHGLRRRGDSELSLDVVRFYFMDARVAEAFRGRWQLGAN
jgi:hypothetical protein